MNVYLHPRLPDSLKWRLSQVVILVGLAMLPHAQAISQAEVPDKIRAPAGEKLVLVARASGSQIYVCQQASSSGGKAQWTLKAPQAQLLDQSGAAIGHHYAGPTWKHKDGSEVSGKVVAQVDSPDAVSIPWLLITVTGRAGSGVLTGVNSIQRIHTHGGQPPPASDCSTSTLNTERNSSYTADYYFYAPER